MRRREEAIETLSLASINTQKDEELKPLAS